MPRNVGLLARAAIATAMALLAPSAARAADGQTDIFIPGDATFVISAPGSYALVNNVTMSVDASCIQITANNVTLDLGGHTITGTGTVNNAPGIDATNRASTVILNGAVQSFSGHGVVLGLRSRISGVAASANRGSRIFGVSENVVENCQALGNANAAAAGAGINAGFSSIVRGCVARSNFTLAPDADCFGIIVGSLSMAVDNICNFNRGNGTGIGGGIRAADGGVVMRNSCVANRPDDVEASKGVGILVFSEWNVMGNNCTGNGADGLPGNNGSGRGIEVAGSGCLIKENNCQDNQAEGGTGAASYRIHIGGSDNRVESNACSRHTGGSGANSSAGIFVAGANNVIFKNSTSGNSSAGIRLNVGANRCQENILGDTTGLSDIGGNSIGAGDLANQPF